MRSLTYTISLLIFIFNCFVLRAQVDWQNADLEKDSFFGISTDKSYKELLGAKKSIPVIVAVIDGGTDTTHEELRSSLWVNKKEIAGNGKDDDHNGYIDDIHGWNFIGGRKGNVKTDNVELTRIMRSQQAFYDSLSHGVVPPEHRVRYRQYRKIKAEYEAELTAAQTNVGLIDALKKTLQSITSKIGKADPAPGDFKQFAATSDEEKVSVNAVLSQSSRGITYQQYINRLDSAREQFNNQAEYQLNISYNPRKIVGDDSRNIRQRNYGNNDVYGPFAGHGTHVAGIIAAARENGTGMQGIANDVLIMTLRVVPDGDERDKDVANAIRYAADNGAKIINMSFGKKYSPDKFIVDEAVQYAMNKDVLIIHAAGNDSKNLDEPENTFFPNRVYVDTKEEAVAWIEVGATGQEDNDSPIPGFSNFGRTKVDVFAPGVNIYSTVPESKYAYMSGTSMAAPVVSGLAALIRGYYPKLSAVQVKEIIMKSVVKRPVLEDKCISGGVVNAYNAIKLAATY